MKKAVMYGAGSIGRGFIGALFSEIGYEVVFIDVNDDVIQLINQEKTYEFLPENVKACFKYVKEHDLLYYEPGTTCPLDKEYPCY